VLGDVNMKREISNSVVVTTLLKIIKGKAIPVRGHGSPQVCETSRLPHFLESRLADGGKIVSLMRRRPFAPRKIPGTYFC
jgi:hypothetical protein